MWNLLVCEYNIKKIDEETYQFESLFIPILLIWSRIPRSRGACFQKHCLFKAAASNFVSSCWTVDWTVLLPRYMHFKPRLQEYERISSPFVIFIALPFLVMRHPTGEDGAEADYVMQSLSTAFHLVFSMSRANNQAK